VESVLARRRRSLGRDRAERRRRGLPRARRLSPRPRFRHGAAPLPSRPRLHLDL
ncbi:MAG: hypothetical protein AVDCRST_MAG08-1621, partial [uncultured Acetobacteraceae bacterium]